MPGGAIGHNRRSRNDVRRPELLLAPSEGYLWSCVEQEADTHASPKHPTPLLSALAPHGQIPKELTLSHQPRVTRKARMNETDSRRVQFFIKVPSRFPTAPWALPATCSPA